MTDEQPHEVYDETAASYAETNHRVEAREEYEWPMVRRLLSVLDGKRVLDAGTCPGHYAAVFADLGAEVVGVDASPEMVAEARERHGEAAEFRRADLREPPPDTDDELLGYFNEALLKPSASDTNGVLNTESEFSTRDAPVARPF